VLVELLCSEGPPLKHRVALGISVGSRTCCWSDRYLWALLYMQAGNVVKRKERSNSTDREGNVKWSAAVAAWTLTLTKSRPQPMFGKGLAFHEERYLPELRLRVLTGDRQR